MTLNASTAPGTWVTGSTLDAEDATSPKLTSAAPKISAHQRKMAGSKKSGAREVIRETDVTLLQSCLAGKLARNAEASAWVNRATLPWRASGGKDADSWIDQWIRSGEEEIP